MPRRTRARAAAEPRRRRRRCGDRRDAQGGRGHRAADAEARHARGRPSRRHPRRRLLGLHATSSSSTTARRARATASSTTSRERRRRRCASSSTRRASSTWAARALEWEQTLMHQGFKFANPQREDRLRLRPLVHACEAAPTVDVMDPFATLGIERTLRRRPRARSRRRTASCRARSTPTATSSAGASERRAALAKAVEVNEAWRIVRDPIRAGRGALRARRGRGRRDGTSRSRRPAFLMEMLEQREALAEAKQAKDLARDRARWPTAIERARDATSSARSAEGFARGASASVARRQARRAALLPALPRRGERDRRRAGRLRAIGDDHGAPRDLRPQGSRRARSASIWARRTRSSRTCSNERPVVIADCDLEALVPSVVPYDAERRRRRRPARAQRARGGAPARHDREREALHGPRRRRPRDAAARALRVRRRRRRASRTPCASRSRAGASVTPVEVSAEILRALKAAGRGRAPQRRRRGHHRARVLRRRPAPGHQGRRRASPGSRCSACSTSRPRRRSRTGSRRSRTAPSRSTISAAARSTSRSSCSTTASSRCSPPAATARSAATTWTARIADELLAAARVRRRAADARARAARARRGARG